MNNEIEKLLKKSSEYGNYKIISNIVNEFCSELKYNINKLNEIDLKLQTIEFK